MPSISNDLTSSSFLVTGGAGFIGSHIVEFLVKNKAGKVVVLDDLSTGSIKNIQEFIKNENISFIEGSIVDLKVCMKACEGIDFVLHQAALGSVPRSIEDPLSTHMVNSTGFLNMLSAARDCKVKRFIYASSSSVYGDSIDLPKREDVIGSPLSPYAVTKRTNELNAIVFAKVYKMNIIGLRYFNIFGPRQNPNGPYAAAIPIFINALLSNKMATINGDGSQTRDFTYVSNAVQANLNAVFADEKALGQVYNIAAGNRVSVLSLYNQLKEIANSTMEVNFGQERTGDVKDSNASIEKAKNLLNFSPEVEFNEGLRNTYNWYKSQLNK